MSKPSLSPASHHRLPTLALVVIARNEAACIERCLMSAKPFVDRMVVLDTGSTDNTVAIAQDCGAQVGHFTWINDFSAARNASLDLANADWNLVMDADEWIESGGEALRSVCSGNPVIGVVCQRSDYEVFGSVERKNTWVSRLLPRGVRYERRIHEQPVSSLPRARLPLVLSHDGYLDAKIEKKLDRNVSLLLEELADRPDDPYVLYQLGKDAEVIAEDFARASDFYTRSAALVPKDAAYRHDLCVRLLFCLSKSGRLEDAITRSGEWMEDWSESPDFFFTVGMLMFDAAAAQPKQADEQWLPMAENAFLRCLEIGERPELDGVAGRGSHMAAHNLCVMYQTQSNTARLKSNYYLDLARKLRTNAEAI
ncbi:glycosyltransferase family 2 protein [Ralstonia soli]|uniref:Glycosyltransferase family 2 protein n=1 Tax=Ralstonia soli TaxID=2953896 RepID=A0ABT1APA4_9RALS|nr:glycosyltransferase family 2 protein [Ralstonia soli]MCO5400270.1 glycosyltransferase family 2 protein [Ralstonia soli]